VPAVAQEDCSYKLARVLRKKLPRCTVILSLSTGASLSFCAAHLQVLSLFVFYGMQVGCVPVGDHRFGKPWLMGKY
jgi:hypothetical protein